MCMCVTCKQFGPGTMICEVVMHFLVLLLLPSVVAPLAISTSHTQPEEKVYGEKIEEYMVKYKNL